MGSWVVLSLLALLASGIHGASLPYHDSNDWHFSQMGVHLDLELKDQTNPLVGGKAHAELPIATIWKLIEADNQLMKTLVIALEKTTLGKLYNIQTVKADITYNAERVLEGIYNIAIDCTIVHKAGTEENVTLLLKGKNESGKVVTSLEVITKNFPVQMTLSCSWPNAHVITINGSFGKILINIANNLKEVSARGVWEYLDQQYKYSSVLSITEKYFTLTYQAPNEETKTLVVKPKIVDSLPTLEISGQVPTILWFNAGEINTQLTPFNLFDYEIKHTNGKMDITLECFTIKTQIIIEYTKTMVKLMFPVTYSNKKMIEIELEYQPTNDFKLLDGGKLKIVASHDSMPIINIGGYCGLTINAANNEVVFNDFYVDVMDGAFKASFSELKLYGKITIDSLNKNSLLPKISIEAKIEKDQKEMFNVLLTTVETGYKLRISYPFLLKNILNIPNLEYIEILHSHVVTGKETTITTICNLTSMKLVAKITPTMISYELMDGEVSLIKYFIQLNKMEVGTNSYLVKGMTNLHLNENSFLYKVLSHVSTSLCFNDWTTNYHLEVVDMAAKKVNSQVHVTKDTMEILNVDINNVQDQTITTTCNFTNKKFIAKITPTMITYELLDGEVSLMKFLNKLSVEVGTNSYLVKGTTNIHLNENSFIYKVLSHVSTSVCFKDFTTNYHLEVVDMAARKVNVQIHGSKDTLEILHVEVTNVQVPTISTICNLTSKKFIAKITPTMMSFELLDGEVSLINYLNQFNVEVATNSYLMKGTTNLSLNENSFIYKVLSYVSTSVCFKDFTTNYHLEVVDKAARKLNVQVLVTKDTLEVIHVEVNNVQVPTISTICNFTSKKFIAKITPTMMSFELFDGEVSLIKYLNQFNVEVATNSYLMKGTTNLSLNEKSFIFKVLSYVSTSICFKDFTTNYHLEVVDKAARKLNVQVLVTKDTLEVLHVEVNNVQIPTITTICNFTSKKFIAKITPTMITFELLDGEVSLIKYLNQLTMEIGTNSYLVKGTTNFSINENIFIYKVLSHVSTNLCFKDWTTNYHLEVVDKTNRKVNVQVQMTKDTLEVLHVEVNNVQVPTITTICNFTSKKFIAKITPTMITVELLDGEVSLMKYLNRLTMEVGTNSYLLKGTTVLSLNENFFIYKVLSHVSASLCFKDWTTNYHIGLVDKAARKVDVQVDITKDTHEILNVEVNNVQVPTITAIINFTSTKIIAKITPTMISYELLDGEVSLMKYLNQFTMEVGTNSYLVKGTTNLFINENSFVYKVLSHVSSSLCFKDWTTNYHLEMVDKAARKVNIQVHATKDTLEILHVEVSNVKAPTLTTICNFTNKKFIAKITPTMISIELLDGEVSLIKYLNQLTMDIGTNTYLVKGTTNLSLNENFFVYKVLSYVSTSMCFKDFTTNYHLEVVDKAARKVNVQVEITKDTVEILNVEVNNVQVPTISTNINFKSKKFIAKITPTLITFELLDGEVSLIKYLNQLTIEIGTNTYLVKGTANLSLNENSLFYKVLSYVSTSLCFKDFTTNYHLEVVDKAARKVNVQVHVTKDTLEILDVEVNNVKIPKITTIFNFSSKKFLAKITPTMITYELFDGELSLVKYVNQLNKMEVGTNHCIVEGKSNLHLNENSYLNKFQCFVSSNLCFKDFTTNYHLEVVDKVARKINVQVHVTKDTLEILDVEVTNVQVPKITTIFNFSSMKFLAKITPTMITYELFDGELSLIKYLNQLNKMEVGTNSYLVEGKSNIHLNENSYLYKAQCFVSSSLCFKDFTTNYHLEVVDKTDGIVDVQVHVTKDTLDILHVEVNNMQVPYKVTLKAPILPLEMIVDYELSTKEWTVMINKINLLKVKPSIGNLYEVHVYEIPLVQLALLKKQVKISTITKDVPAITAIITWKTLSIFENTVGIQLLYKQIAHKTLFGWNINQLKKAFVDFKVTGSGIPLLGDYKIFHHLNWYITDIKNVDFEWNGKVLSTDLAFLNKPLVTDGKLKINNYAIHMMLVEKYKNEPYTVILKTKPLKIALLPFFAYP